MRALYIQWRVGDGTNSLIVLIPPIPEAIFLDNLSMSVCHRRFLSINIPSDFTEVTFTMKHYQSRARVGSTKYSIFFLIQLA